MWMYVVVFVAALALSYASMPKPQSVKPAGLGDYNVPTAEEGREIPVLFGTKDIDAPNVVWWGDVKTVAIKKEGGKK